MKDQERPQNYKDLLKYFSKQELTAISQLKRFFEWVQGDPEFCAYTDTGNFPQPIKKRLKQIGISFDLNEIAIIWKFPKIVLQYIEKSRTGSENELPQETIKAIESYPLFVLWIRFVTLKQRLHRKVCQEILPISKQPKFELWRSRRILSVRSELGYYGYTINHPILSFELSDGCSVGCWFCAFATRKLKGNLNYEKEKDFFQAVTHHCVKLFGKEHAGKAMLYCGTEPHDNPSYIEFLKDYTKITGSPPFTSTAVSHDTAWLRNLIAFYRQGSHALLRISVLSKSMLYKIHESYAPEELRDVELLMQMKNNSRPKVSSGRILKQERGLRSREEGHYLDGNTVPQGSIECMSGFLINLVNRTIQLISPCYSSPKWPFGYRIFDTMTFNDAEDFPRVMEMLIDRNMPESPKKDMVMQFRDDLEYRITDEGFDLISPNQVHHFQGKKLYRIIGKLIARNDLTYSALCDFAMEKYQLNIIIIIIMLKKLFDSGLLNEVF